MPEIPVGEYINSLLTAYQYAEKIYSQAVSDAVAAEIRRDEAKKVRDELLVRLENAREKYTPNGTSPKAAGGSPLRGRTPPRPARKNGDGVARRKQIPQHLSKRKVVNREAMEQPVPAEAPKTPTGIGEKVEAAPVVSAAAISPDIVLSSLADNRDNDAMRKQVPQHPSTRKMTIKEATEQSVPPNTSPDIVPPQSTADTSDGGGRRKQTPQHQSTRKVPSREATEQPIPVEAQKTPTRTGEKVEASPVAALATISSDILLSPTAGSKKAPRIFLSPGTPRKRSSRVVSLIPLLEDAKPILGIAPGRTRDWYEKNFDCDSAGLVKKFYQAAFGTKTNEKTHAVTVKTVVLNDEWNEFVTDTSQIQEMYIGKSKEKDGKPNPRDKAAEALVNPPQKEPIALFFAPKKSQDTGLVFYGGHWKVIDGKMLSPPRAVKGQTRQWLVKFAFVGVDHLILNALDKTPE